MIDSLMNNKSAKKQLPDPKHRPSVLAKLRQKQKEIVTWSDKALSQENEVERSREKKIAA